MDLFFVFFLNNSNIKWLYYNICYNINLELDSVSLKYSNTQLWLFGFNNLHASNSGISTAGRSELFYTSIISKINFVG